MRYHWIIPLLASIASLALGIVVFRRGPRKAVSRVFAFTAVALVLWNLNFFVLYFVADKELAFALLRFIRAGAVFVPAAVLHLIVSLHSGRSRTWHWIIGVNYAYAGGMAALSVTDLLVSDIQPSSWGYSSVGTVYYSLFAVSAVGNLLAALGVLIYDYRTTTDPRLRLQLKFWLTGAGIALPLGCTNVLPAYGIPFYPLGNLGNAAWAAIVAYAIVRHRLMDIDLVISKGVAYGAVSLILIVPTFGLSLWLQQLSFGTIHTDFSFAIFLMLATVGVLFPTLRLRAESRIQQSLFREKHEYRLALQAFTRSIVSILDRERLLREVVTTLVEVLRLERIAVALRDEVRSVYAVRSGLGAYVDGLEFPDGGTLVDALHRRQGAVLREEFETSDDAVDQSAGGICLTNEWEVCVPLRAGSSLIGFIALGRKRDLEAFFSEDLNLLETLAAQVSVALENARLYEELKRSQDIIRRSDRLSALGTLAAGIAHEIRNPLVSIQTFFQLAPQRLHDQEFLTEFLRLTSGEVKRITDLITELLSFAKSPTPSRCKVDLNEILDGVVRLVEPQLRRGQLRIERHLSQDLPLVLADRDQLKQIFLNILLNAVQAMERSRGEIILSSRTSIHQGETFCEVQIRDTGSGISHEIVDHIFDPFFTTKEKGTGLGLAIAHQMVSEHGGFIGVDSELGKGTTFSVYFRPVAQVEEDFTDREPTARQAIGGRMRIY